MDISFKYRFDRLSRRITLGVSVFVAALFVLFHFIWGADYLPAWIVVMLLCIIALYILSIPRYIRLDTQALEIHCLVELTRIHVEDIEYIRRIDRREFRHLIPLLGSYGFGGYYGYYFNLHEWNVYRVYASERRNLVLIEDIYEDTYLVSCTDPDRLVELTTEARNRKRREILEHTSENNPEKRSGI